MCAFYVLFHCGWISGEKPCLTSKLRNNLVGRDSIVPHSCWGCKPVTVHWDDCSVTWLATHTHAHTHAHTQRNLPSAYMVRARPFGSDRPGQAIKSHLILSCFTPLCCRSFLLLSVLLRVEGHDKWWQLLSPSLCFFSFLFFLPGIGLIFSSSWQQWG